MYDIYCNLRDSKGINDSKVAADTGVSRSTFSDWKSKRSSPSTDKLIRIADYFGVSVDYLTTGKELVEGESDPDIRRIQRARSNMSAQEKEKMMKLLEVSFEDYFGDDFVDEDSD